MQLTAEERAILAGDLGPAQRFALDLVVRTGQVMGARRLIAVRSAHVASCFYSGSVNLDFAEFLVAAGAEVAVPTTLNVGSVDLLHPELRPEGRDSETVAGARRLMQCYERLGCRVTWTCAPYQLDGRPGFGDQVVESESNSVAFTNSVLGARAEKYGDFLDICAAVTGRVPLAGLHRPENRRGQILFTLPVLPDSLLESDMLYHVLGYLVGRMTGHKVPIIQGLPPSASEDQLKALGAAAAASGAVKLFHVLGVTPEAPDLEAACRGGEPETRIAVTGEMLLAARDALSTAAEGRPSAVCLGTPHFSLTEFERLVGLLAGRRVHPEIRLYVATSRHVLEQVAARGWQASLEAAGATLVVDTCTYFLPLIEGCGELVMTPSAKWAYYAPGNLGVKVVFGSLPECVASAVEGRVVRRDETWRGLDAGKR